MKADDLAAILFAHEHRSRRQAKRVLFERTDPPSRSAAALDAALHAARMGPLREQVAARVAEMIEDAARANRACEVFHVEGTSLPEWIIGEAADDFRWYILHFGEHPFVAEVLDGDEIAGEDDDVRALVAGLLDDGQVLFAVRWIGSKPCDEAAAELFRAARRAMRAYDMRGGIT